ncbi:lysophosphatidylcholine acyltransferase 1-like [Oppia nitens]|uniref:lysophosphatidylcholine acyltransferase 1-like n=1 Tax=Oppia nitens TaxID=1686743 RepID=UPI0023DBDA28|nr:lysophosphatidylcholine acyltransferase 1-like [Oppia nitens]
MTVSRQMSSHIKDKSFGKLAKTILNTQLNEICVNPFINKIQFTKFDYLKIYVFGSILFLVRIIPMLLCIALSAILASIFFHLLNLLSLLRIPTNTLRKVANFIVYGILRICLFFGGFYWIKVSDKSKKSAVKPNIIAIAPHTTFWDMISMLKLGIPAIVSRIENSRIPFIGSIIKLSDPIYVNREDRESRSQATNDIKERAMKGKILLFPEGTCINGNTLIQFKLGAFLPQLPVQPVVLKWDNGKHDLKSWVEEGPSLLKILYYSLSQMWINCEIIKLEPYFPNEEEKLNASLFANNVQKVMCDELGVIQSFYTYDDVMFMGFANEIRLFRSPVCIKLLKVCYKMAKESTIDSNFANLSKKIKAPKFAPIFQNLNYLGIGEDFDHGVYVPDFYVPKALLNISGKKTKSKKVIQKKRLENDSNAKRLPLSGVIRKEFDISKTVPQFALTSDVAQEKRYVYETFCHKIQTCINDIEKKGEIRTIESTEDLAQLLGYDKSSKIVKSSAFVDLLKALEFSTVDGPTTLHLLAVLHLCDCREPDLWERIRAAINLLSLHMKTSKSDDKFRPESPESEATLNLLNFKTLLWYSLGLQQFNDRFFVKHDFDFQYIRQNMKRLFKRAVDENAQSLE